MWLKASCALANIKISSCLCYSPLLFFFFSFASSPLLLIWTLLFLFYGSCGHGCFYLQFCFFPIRKNRQNEWKEFNKKIELNKVGKWKRIEQEKQKEENAKKETCCYFCCFAALHFCCYSCSPVPHFSFPDDPHCHVPK